MVQREDCNTSEGGPDQNTIVQSCTESRISLISPLDAAARPTPDSPASLLSALWWRIHAVGSDWLEDWFLHFGYI